MAKNILQALPELILDQVISEETAEKIRYYYRQRESRSQNRLFIVFGVLGALLAGLGIILIIAHNWDDLSRTTKTVFSFLPLVIGQLVCGFTLIRKSDNIGWRESSATFLFFAVGASMALISQVYHIPGNLSEFLFTWALLGIPLVYVMRSSVVSLLYVAGITWYACEVNYWTYQQPASHHYWWLLVLVLPYVYWLWKKHPESNFMLFHHWLLPVSLTITLGTLAHHTEELMFIAYFSLFGVFYQVGNTASFSNRKLLDNSWQLLGTAGTLALLFTLSFDWFWKELIKHEASIGTLVTTPEFLVALLLTVAATVLLFRRIRNSTWDGADLMNYVYGIFIVLFVIGYFNAILPIVVINILLLAMGILTIRKGAKANHLGILNYGLLMITLLIICRFFDVQISFVIRGLLFLLVGVGFFLLNYQMLKRKKQPDQNKRI